MKHLAPLFLLLMMTAPVSAGSVEIVDAKASEAPNGWRFNVTLRHDDTGWDHYADGWAVLAPDGTQLGYRELLHPHVNEQPFTRSLSGVVVPDGIDRVIIRARDKVHGWADREFVIMLAQ